MKQPSALRTFNFEVNAIFAKELLSKYGIESSIKEISDMHKKRYELITNDESKDKALIELNKMDLDDGPIHEDSEGYLEGTNEWFDHMYNPTYYLGGKTPRYYFDKKNWKFFAPFFLALGLFWLIVILNAGLRSSNFEALIFMALFIFVGSSLIWQLNRKKK